MNITPEQLSKINVGLSQFLQETMSSTDVESKTTLTSSNNKTTSNKITATITNPATIKQLQKTSTTIKQMQNVNEASMHGRMGIGRNWSPPTLVHQCNKKARPGYDSMMANEYEEDPVVLSEKVKLLAFLLTSAEHCIAYTGAGISTSSGIDDYASKGCKSKMKTSKYRPKTNTGLAALPSFAHYTLAALEKQNQIQCWIQQNHDGLPQKANFPPNKMNEIHGAWFDPSNPVVPMNGSLRDDLYEWMLEEEQKADLVLTMGTSLSGMNADRVVTTASEKFTTQGIGLGSVIIGFQRTRLDDICSLRIFSRIDEVMLLLAREMKLNMNLTPYQFKGNSNHVYKNLPYDSVTGKKKEKKNTCQLNLQRGAKIKLTGGPGKGYIGHVVRTPNMNGGQKYAYTCQFPCTREHSKEQGKKPSYYSLGGWIIEAAMRGEISELPVVNV